MHYISKGVQGIILAANVWLVRQLRMLHCRTGSHHQMRRCCDAKTRVRRLMCCRHPCCLAQPFSIFVWRKALQHSYPPWHPACHAAALTALTACRPLHHAALLLPVMLVAYAECEPPEGAPVR